jgi:DegV family protein with EDD domain
VIFGQRAYLDGVDLIPSQFYQMLGTADALPRTEPPHPEEIYNLYMRLAAAGASGIVSLHISSRLSATVAAALEAAKHVPSSLPVTVIDSGQVSIGLLPAVRFAAQMAQVGAPVEAIEAAVGDVISHTRLFFLVDTLEYLQRGGRIGRAQRMLGTLLDAKPILTIQEGEVAPVETVRPRQRAFGRLEELVRGLGPVRELYVGQTSDDLGQHLSADVRRFYDGPLHRGWIGATVGTHMGMGVGVAAIVPR